MLGRRAREEGCARVCRARVAVRREVRAVAGKRGLPRGRAPGFMCNEAAEFLHVGVKVRVEVERGGIVCVDELEPRKVRVEPRDERLRRDCALDTDAVLPELVVLVDRGLPVRE